MRPNGPGQSPLLLLDVIDILNKLNIPYAVVGALAASFYGTIRASIDADAVISLKDNTKGPQDLSDELIKAGFKATRQKGDKDDPIAGVINVLDNYGNRVDLLTGIRGMKTDVFSRTVDSFFGGSKVHMIGLEDFIAMKIFAGSPKDMEDAKNALKVSAEKVNLTLLKKLVSCYGEKELDILKKFSKELKK